MNLSSIKRLIGAIVRPMAVKINTMITRGVVSRVDDTTKMQSLQLQTFADGARDGVERFQQYGFSSIPPADSECITVAVGGRQYHLVAISVDDRSVRPTGSAANDVLLYSAGQGILVRLDDANGLLHLGTDVGDEFVALAETTKSELDGIKSDLDAIKQWAAIHIHPTGVGPSDKTANPLTLTYSPTSVASSNVKAKK